MQVSGKVVDKETGQGIEKAAVGILEIKNNQPVGMRTMGTTNKDGKYLLEMFPPGEYWLVVYPPKNSQYVLDLSLTKKIQIIRGRNVVNVDFHLEQGGTISGRVTEADGVTGVENTSIVVFSSNGDAGMGSATSDKNGNYKVPGLAFEHSYHNASAKSVSRIT